MDDILPDFDPWWARFQIVHKVPHEIADKLEGELREFVFELYEAEADILEDGRSYDDGYECAIHEFELRRFQGGLLCEPDREMVDGWIKKMRTDLEA